MIYDLVPFKIEGVSSLRDGVVESYYIGDAIAPITKGGRGVKRAWQSIKHHVVVDRSVASKPPAPPPCSLCISVPL